MPFRRPGFGAGWQGPLCSSMGGTGSWACFSFASEHVAILTLPWVALPRILPLWVARKRAQACPLLAQNKAAASFLGPGTSKRHKNTRAEPNAPAPFPFAVCPDPFPPDTWTPFCKFSGQLSHGGMQAASPVSARPVVTVGRCPYEGMRVA